MNGFSAIRHLTNSQLCLVMATLAGCSLWCLAGCHSPETLVSHQPQTEVRPESHSKTIHQASHRLNKQQDELQITVTGEVNYPGEVKGLRKGQKVIDALQAAGGLTEAATSEEIELRRPDLANEGQPVVFLVDLQGILFNGDSTTNFPLQAGDTLHIPARSRMFSSPTSWFSR